MIKKYLSLLTILFMLSSVNVLCQTEMVVSDSRMIIDKLQNLNSGDIVLVKKGTYNLNKRIEITVNGSQAKPVVIKAEVPGTVIFSENSWFTFRNSSFVIFEGFEFVSNNGPAVELLGCNNVRITNNVFHLKETGKSSWIYIGNDKNIVKNTSHHNRIDHNLFENKSFLGNFITIEGTMEPEYQVSQYDLIDNNYFRDIGPRAENVLEAIRIGSSHVSLSSGFTIIEKNLFERCDGDPESVSIKSSDNIVRYNTFRECLGVLSLRHGNRNTVDGNFFLGNGRTGEFIDSTKQRWVLGTGGVRFCGDNMKIINNYFEGLTGVNWDASLALTNGDADYGTGQSLTKHYRNRYTIVAFNTFINNKSNIEVGYDGGGFQNNWWRLPAKEITIANNLIIGNSGKLIDIINQPVHTAFTGNIVLPSGTAVVGADFTKEEVKVMNPGLKKSGLIWENHPGSKIKDKAAGSFPYVDKDIQGQNRKGKKDVGCDEVDDSEKRNKALTGSDVGPSWYAKK